MIFRWNDWNVQHIARHGVTPEEAEEVVRAASNPFPRKIEDEKYFVWGQSGGGRMLQVIFVSDPDGITSYIIHARPLNEQEKRRYRRIHR